MPKPAPQPESNPLRTFYAVRLDESYAVCDPTLLARCGGKLWTVYVYDAGEVTHLCEFTPSYWLEEIENIPEQWPDMEQDFGHALDCLTSDLLECASDEYGIYVHCHEIDRLPVEQRVPLGEFESMDEAREYYQGSPRW